MSSSNFVSKSYGWVSDFSLILPKNLYLILDNKSPSCFQWSVKFPRLGMFLAVQSPGTIPATPNPSGESNDRCVSLICVYV